MKKILSCFLFTLMKDFLFSSQVEEGEKAYAVP